MIIDEIFNHLVFIITFIIINNYPVYQLVKKHWALKRLQENDWFSMTNTNLEFSTHSSYHNWETVPRAIIRKIQKMLLWNWRIVFSLPVTWLKGMQDVSSKAYSRITVKDTRHTWTLRELQLTDCGTYTIQASNVHGKARAYCSVKVCLCLRR